MEKNPTRLPGRGAFLTVVAGALQRADGRWLLHQRPPGKAHAGLWEFPGGKGVAHVMPAESR
ncbi:MAG: NUDIX domain-containing protein, partial [Erythrobacter cryptus]